MKQSDTAHRWLENSPQSRRREARRESIIENSAITISPRFNFIGVSPARLLDFEPPAEPRPLPEAYRQRLAETGIGYNINRQ